MSNLTLTIDDQVLRRARIRALEEGTSVNARVREYLVDYAWGDTRLVAIEEFLEVAASGEAGSGPSGRSWRRDELYERG